jgi:hypothetical protein
MPASAGVPNKLQRVFDDPSAIQIHGFHPQAYDPSKNAFVWFVSADQISYIDHGIAITRVGLMDKDGKAWVKENLPHPFYFEAIIDGQEIHMLRYTTPINLEGGRPHELNTWAFYHIFEPGDLTVGDHEFNMIWYVGIENSERFEYLNLYEAFSAGYGIDALIIRVS